MKELTIKGQVYQFNFGTILYYGNKGQNPRLTEALIEEFIDDPDTDIDDLFEEVMGFLKSSNATKCITEKTLKAVEDMMK